MICSIIRTVRRTKYYNISGLANAVKSTSNPIHKRPSSVEKSVKPPGGAINAQPKKSTYSPEQKTIAIPAKITAKDLAKLINVRYIDFQKKARESLGIDVSEGSIVLDQDSASLMAMEFDCIPETLNDLSIESVMKEHNLIKKRPPLSNEAYNKCPQRAPVVTIMGHVDHGKTTLLDSLRKTSVAASEFGGITQHIGAFSVLLPSNKRITFLDTPGHAAFSAMRARGARVTDMVVIVVAADDGVMPQTIEAINHAKAANVPIIIAVNKCDKPDANPDHVLRQLLDHDIVVEKFGGDIQSVNVSAVKGQGLAELEETLLVQAEIQGLRGDTEGPVELCVLESKMVQGKGIVATVLVQRGTLNNNDVIVFGGGKNYCQIRKISDENGKELNNAGPSVPCEIWGAWSSAPEAGDEGIQVASKSDAKTVITKYEEAVKQRKSLHDSVVSHRNLVISRGTLQMKERLFEAKRSKLQLMKHNSDLRKKYVKDLDQLRAEILEMQSAGEKQKLKKIKKLLLVVKADTHGSVEAVSHALLNLQNKLKQKKKTKSIIEGSETSVDEDLSIKILHSAVGGVTQSDIDLLASTSSDKSNDVKCAIIGFNIPQVPKKLTELLRKYSVPVISEQIIYKLLDQIQDAAKGMLTPDYEYDVAGEADVLQVFDISNGKDKVAGCRVIDGTLFRTKSLAFEGSSSVDSGSIMYRVLRNGVKIYTGEIKSLKHHKNDASSIPKGMECGVSFGDAFKDIQPGDRIQCIKKWIDSTA